jgi:hypothetical protein
MVMSDSYGLSFASRSLPQHLLRGVIGFGSFAAAFGLGSVIGPFSLVFLPVGLVALRGCPMCWTMGLVETISNGRLKRRCVDETCSIVSTARQDQLSEREPVGVGSGHRG